MASIVLPPERPPLLPREPKQREWVRAFLALALVAVFAVEVIFSIWFLAHSCPDLDSAVKALKELAEVFLGPTVALVGAATGFYFGRSQSH